RFRGALRDLAPELRELCPHASESRAHFQPHVRELGPDLRAELVELRARDVFLAKLVESAVEVGDELKDHARRGGRARDARQACPEGDAEAGGCPFGYHLAKARDSQSRDARRRSSS